MGVRFKIFGNVAFERKISLQRETFEEFQRKNPRIKWNLHANKKKCPPKASGSNFSHLVQLQLGFFVFQVAELAILSLVAIAIDKTNAKASTDLAGFFSTTSHIHMAHYVTNPNDVPWKFEKLPMFAFFEPFMFWVFRLNDDETILPTKKRQKKIVGASGCPRLPLEHFPSSTGHL